MPKLFDDENVGVFMNIDEKHFFALTAHVCGKTPRLRHERRGERLVRMFTSQNSTYTLINNSIRYRSSLESCYKR